MSADDVVRAIEGADADASAFNVVRRLLYSRSGVDTHFCGVLLGMDSETVDFNCSVLDQCIWRFIHLFKAQMKSSGSSGSDEYGVGVFILASKLFELAGPYINWLGGIVPVFLAAMSIAHTFADDITYSLGVLIKWMDSELISSNCTAGKLREIQYSLLALPWPETGLLLNKNCH